jgi:hypothetical protein
MPALRFVASSFLVVALVVASPPSAAQENEIVVGHISPLSTPRPRQREEPELRLPPLISSANAAGACGRASGWSGATT